jgi:mono/diheme cytochrome c family protein
MRQALLVSAIVFLIFAPLAKDQSSAAQTQLPSEWVPSGEVMYKQFCAACHGARAKGNGPAAPTLKRQPPDLTTLAKRHGGKFPYDYVSSILRFGPGSSAHGSSEMPTWGPIFQTIDKKSEPAVEDRIRNLVDYLASLQRK